MLGFLPDFARTIVSFLVVLGVLVFIHELGHYLAARWRGVHVDVFSIGFGSTIASWRDRVGTEWKVSWLPLGGYVKLHGQAELADLPPEEVAALRPGQTFHDKPVKDRAIVVAAGPVANFLLAIVLFALLFATHGRPIGDTTISAIAPGSAAEVAGLQPGDQVVSLDGEPIRRFEELQRHIQPRAGQPVRMVLTRDGREVSVTVTPAARPGSESAPVGVLGVQGGGTRFEQLSIPAALVAGVTQTWDVSSQTLVGIAQMLTGQRSARDLGGPIRIAEVSGEAASLGWVAVVNLMALLSVSLGLLNLFPVPMLDGGHLVFYAAEAIRGRPLSARAMEIGFRAGFALLICLFVFATWNDIAHGSIGRWVAGLVG